MSGTPGVTGIIGVVVVVFAVNGGVYTEVGEMDDEHVEEGFERNKTLIGVEKLLG